MGYLISFTLFGCGLFLYRNKKNLASPDILFCFEWSFISLLASMKLFTLFDIAIKTWFIIFIGSFSLIIGIYFGNRIKFSNKKYFFFIHSNKIDLICRWFYIFSFVIFIFKLGDLKQSLEYLAMGYSLGDIRLASVGLEQISGFTRAAGGVQEYLQILLSAIETIIVATGIVLFISDYKRFKKIMLITLVLVLIDTIINGGRFGLFYVIIELIVCFLLFKYSPKNTKKKLLSKKTKKIAKRIIIFLLIMIFYVTLFRGAESSEIIEKYYRYICGNIVFFDLRLVELNSTDFMSYGFAGLYGLWKLVLPLFNLIGLNYPSLYLKTINQVMNTQEYLHIGTSLSTNAFITPFYHLYADFRIIGVILGMFIFGAICGYFFKKAKSCCDLEWIIFYIVIVQMIFKTLQMYPFTSQIYVVVLIIIWILSKIKVYE